LVPQRRNREFTQWRPREIAVDDVYFLNASTFLNVRYSLYSFGITQGSDHQSDNFDLASLGFPASYVNSIPPRSGAPGDQPERLQTPPIPTTPTTTTAIPLRAP